MKWEKVGKAGKCCEEAGKLAVIREKTAAFSHIVPVRKGFQAPLGAPRRPFGSVLFPPVDGLFWNPRQSACHPRPRFILLDSKFWILCFMALRARPPCSTDPNSRPNFPHVKSRANFARTKAT